jgi:hypothetical protein
MSDDKPSDVQMTVRQATYNLLRRLGLTTVFDRGRAIRVLSVNCVNARRGFL